MNLIRPKEIEDHIVVTLLSKEMSTTSLLSAIINTKNSWTKQGFYKALKRLSLEEVVIISKKIVSLNLQWIIRMSDLIDSSRNKYSQGGLALNFMHLQPNESITYKFKSIRALDNFWGQAQHILMSTSPNKFPIYSYDPHYWFYLVRKEVEDLWLDEMTQNKRKFLMTVGGNTFLDKKIKERFNNQYLQYNINKQFPKNNLYLTIVDNIVIEVELDENICKQIESDFDRVKKISEVGEIDLKKYLDKPSNNKLKISKNISKSNKYSQKMSGGFY